MPAGSRHGIGLTQRRSPATHFLAGPPPQLSMPKLRNDPRLPPLAPARSAPKTPAALPSGPSGRHVIISSRAAGSTPTQRPAAPLCAAHVAARGSVRGSNPAPQGPVEDPAAAAAGSKVSATEGPTLATLHATLNPRSPDHQEPCASSHEVMSEADINMCEAISCGTLTEQPAGHPRAAYDSLSTEDMHAPDPTGVSTDMLDAQAQFPDWMAKLEAVNIA